MWLAFRTGIFTQFFMFYFTLKNLIPKKAQKKMY